MCFVDWTAILITWSDLSLRSRQLQVEPLKPRPTTLHTTPNHTDNMRSTPNHTDC